MNSLSIQFHELGHAYLPGQWVFRQYAGIVSRGKVFAILGPNGCGKTTLLKVLLGALSPTAGRVEVHGQIAFVPQLFQVSFGFSALDMVLMGRARKVKLFDTPSRADQAAAMSALERLGLAAFADRPFDQLSGGQRQLVIFARALASEADILIMDEPTSALDMRNQGVTLEWISRLAHREGLTVLFTTHNPHHAMAVADTTMLMTGTDEFLCGPTSEIMRAEALAGLYGVDMVQVRYEYGGKSRKTIIPVYERVE